MANLIYSISLAMTFMGLASPSFVEGYPCKKPWALTKLDYLLNNLPGEHIEPKVFHNILNKPEYRQSTYRGIRVSELLAMVDVSKAKCNWDEFERRTYYRSIFKMEPDALRTDYISQLHDQLRRVCNVKDGWLHQEALAATNADRDIIQQVISAGNLERKTDLVVSQVKKATEKYISSRPGRKDFVISAGRLRIYDACLHVKYIKELVWGDQFQPSADKNLFANHKICAIYSVLYIKEYAKRKGKAITEIGREWMERYGYWGAKNKLLNHILTFPIFALAASSLLVAGIMSPFVYLLPRFIYRKMIPKKKPRDGTSEKYFIYPVKHALKHKGVRSL